VGYFSDLDGLAGGFDAFRLEILRLKASARRFSRVAGGVFAAIS
jgi:hypothetical protein